MGSSDRTVDVLPSGALRVAETLELRGYPAAMMREFLRQYDPSQWKEAMLQAIRARGQTALIRGVEVERLEETDLSLGLALDYEIESGFSKVTSGLVGRLPMIWETEFLGVEPVEERASPFDVMTPIRFSGRVRLAPPQGYALKHAATEPKAAEAGRFTRWSASLDDQSGGLDLRYEIVRGAGHYPPSQYQLFHEETDQAFRFLRQPIELAPISQ